MSKNIHSTAIIEDGADIHSSVKIGPYSIIKKNVSIGENTIIGSHVVIDGVTTIGKNNHIFSHNSIGQAPQDKKYNKEETKLRIGDSNTIREFCTINTGTVQDNGITQIGSNNWIMAYVHIAHDCVIANNIIMANNSSLAGHVEIGDYAILGGFTLVHQFCKIGSHIMSAVGTKVFKDIPDFLMVHGEKASPSGLNIEGLKRRNFSSDDLNELRKAYKIIYRENNTVDEAIKILDQSNNKNIMKLTKFIKSSQRGIVR
ncbi:MAG: acyl-ACP--UDP-N-acetylglucosamine O-acyltransferase [Betaproteobacteria bacterium]|nr:acyl-ACP--UDP-N-acetylglucosamine O-acyltransferase [Betaproteobacteria bacterium]